MNITLFEWLHNQHRQQITQALNQAGISPSELNIADVGGIVISLVVLVALELGLGADSGGPGRTPPDPLLSASTPVAGTVWTPPPSAQ